MRKFYDLIQPDEALVTARALIRGKPAWHLLSDMAILKMARNLAEARKLAEKVENPDQRKAILNRINA